MAETLFLTPFLCLDGYDVTGTSKGFPFKWSQEVKEWICFTDPETGSTRKRLPGAESAELPIDGYLDFGGNFLLAQANLGNGATVLTFGARRTQGSTAYLFPAVQGDASWGGPVGDVVPFAADMKSNGTIVEGVLFEYEEVAATADGDDQELGAVLSTQNLVLHLHTCKAPGGTSPTLDVIFESSALGDFSDAVTVHTFTQLTGRGRERAVIPGPITDTHYRFAYAVGGTGSPEFLVRAAAGIR